MSEQKVRPFGLDDARRFIREAGWTFAESYAAFAPHEYTTRAACRVRGIEREFTAFAQLIEDTGFWRPWGRSRWRSLVVDEMTYWLYKVYEPAWKRTVVNRRRTAEMATPPAQLTLIEDDEA